MNRSRVRPWSPPSLTSSSSLIVSDLNSTYISLLVRSREINCNFMILVNGLHWDHIAQSSTTSSSSLPGEGITAEQEQDWEESGLVQLILFGLEQGKDYEIELSCSSTAQNSEEELIEPLEELVESLPPPPPYSPAPAQTPSIPSSPTSLSAQTSNLDSEINLRQSIKKLRQTAKRTETSLASSIGSYKKSIEKSIKEDQRLKSRIVALEESIKKLDELVGGFHITETARIAVQYSALSIVLKEQTQELESRMNSTYEEEEEEVEGDLIGPGLRAELDSLNKALELVDAEKRSKSKILLPKLEAGLNEVESELLLLEREESYHYQQSTFNSHRFIPTHSNSNSFHSTSSNYNNNSIPITRSDSAPPTPTESNFVHNFAREKQLEFTRTHSPGTTDVGGLRRRSGSLNERR